MRHCPKRQDSERVEVDSAQHPGRAIVRQPTQRPETTTWGPLKSTWEARDLGRTLHAAKPSHPFGDVASKLLNKYHSTDARAHT